MKIMTPSEIEDRDRTAPGENQSAIRNPQSQIRDWLRGRGALLAGAGLVMFYCLIAVFADLLAPYDYSSLSRREPFAPPTTIRFRDAQGRWHARPFVYARQLLDPATQRYEEITDRAYPLELFARGYSYEFLWLFPTDLHLFGTRAEAGGRGLFSAPPRPHNPVSVPP